MVGVLLLLSLRFSTAVIMKGAHMCVILTFSLIIIFLFFISHFLPFPSFTQGNVSPSFKPSIEFRPNNSQGVSGGGGGGGGGGGRQRRRRFRN